MTWARLALTPRHLCRHSARQGLWLCSLWPDLGDREEQAAGAGAYRLDPGPAPLKTRVICASPQDATKHTLRGIKHELQANCQEEARNSCTLMEKLGGSVSSPWKASLPSRAPCSPCLQYLPPRTCPQRFQAARSLPERRGWRDSSTGRAISSPQSANTPCTSWTLLLPHSRWYRPF